MNLAAKDLTFSRRAALTGLLGRALRNHPGLRPWAITCRPFRAPEGPPPFGGLRSWLQSSHSVFSGVNEPQESKLGWRVMTHWSRQIVLSSVILVAVVGFLNAERVTTVSSSVDLVAAADDNPQLDTVGAVPTPPRGNFFLTYGVYPSIALNSRGPKSNLRLSYSFGFNRVDSQEDIETQSHTFGGEVGAQLTRNVQLRVRETFTRTSDLRTFNLFRGILVTPEGLFFDSETIALHQDYYQNRASIDLDYSLNPNSSLSLGFGHSMRRYQENLPSATDLSDQNGFNGNLRYTNITGSRSSWDLGYSVSQYDFQDFESARTHYVSIGFSHQLSPTVSLSLGTGPSYTEAHDRQSSFLSLKNGSLTLSKSFENNLLSFSYLLRSGTSTGVGSLSDVGTFRFDFSRSLGRRTSVGANVSLYNTEARLDNPTETRGLSTSLVFNFLLHNHWSLVLGGSYQNQQEDINGIGRDVERKRVFVSLRVTLPELMRF